MARAAEFFIDPVEPLGALFGPLFVSCLQLLNRCSSSMPELRNKENM